MADHTRHKEDSFGSTGHDDKQVLLPIRAVIVPQERSTRGCKFNWTSTRVSLSRSSSLGCACASC